MNHSAKPLDRAAAENGADDVADSDSEAVAIMDVHVAGARSGYVINVTL
jgi:hypothetical protein